MALPSHISERDGAVLVTVRVRPRGGRDAVEGVRAGALTVRVAAPPVGGAANDAVRRLLAKACGVAPGRVTVVRGRRGRDKVVRVEGASGESVAARLAEAACG